MTTPTAIAKTIEELAPNLTLTKDLADRWTNYQGTGIQSYMNPLLRLAGSLEGRVQALENYIDQLEQRVKELEDEADRT